MATGSGTNFSTTPNMGLFQPTPGVCGAIGVEPPGKSWMELYNSSLGMLDQHNHAPGFGAQIPAAGININADLAFGSFNATGLRSTRYSAIALGTLSPSDVGCLVLSGSDLYFVDGNANQIRITQSGGVAGTPGSISGLSAPASISYNSGSKLFTFLSSAPRVAALAIGSVSVGDATVDNGKSATISVPAGLAGNYALTLPAALPGATGLMSLSAAGAISTFAVVSGSDLTLAGNLALSAATPVLSATGSNAPLGIKGNRNAADTGADLIFNSQATRSAGLLADFQNNSSSKLRVDYQGLLSLASQAAPLQAASYVTAISPNAHFSVFDGAAYWKDASGMVHLKGRCTADGLQGLVLFTLPAGFRPTATRYFATTTNTGSSMFLIKVDANGDVSPVNTSGTTINAAWLDGTHFLAEQ